MYSDKDGLISALSLVINPTRRPFLIQQFLGGQSFCSIYTTTSENTIKLMTLLKVKTKLADPSVTPSYETCNSTSSPLKERPAPQTLWILFSTFHAAP